MARRLYEAPPEAFIRLARYHYWLSDSQRLCQLPLSPRPGGGRNPDGVVVPAIILPARTRIIRRHDGSRAVDDQLATPSRRPAGQHRAFGGCAVCDSGVGRSAAAVVIPRKEMSDLHARATTNEQQGSGTLPAPGRSGHFRPWGI